MRRRKIDSGLALALAGQVSVGLAPGDAQAARSRMALTVIGTMIRQASGHDANVEEVLGFPLEDDPTGLPPDRIPHTDHA